KTYTTQKEGSRMKIFNLFPISPRDLTCNSLVVRKVINIFKAKKRRFYAKISAKRRVNFSDIQPQFR
ncbi:MAG: hypothetical protein IJV69_01010, partial [Kiritimatiellae bacterium]|nr:hypothetical protein [Kiritimatiellia bacterium]